MVEQHVGLDEGLKACSELVGQGSINAVSGLSQMIGQEISVTSMNARLVPANETPDLIGGWEALTLGVYLSVTGCAEGHMFMVYEPQTAMALADLLMGNPPGTTQSLDEMETSALGEVGNIMGSFFLNSLADNTNSQLQPVFGRLLAQQIKQWYGEMGSPPDFTVVEMGRQCASQSDAFHTQAQVRAAPNAAEWCVLSPLPTESDEGFEGSHS